MVIQTTFKTITDQVKVEGNLVKDIINYQENRIFIYNNLSLLQCGYKVIIIFIKEILYENISELVDKNKILLWSLQ